MNQMEIFKNPEFGSIRVIEENGKYLFCGMDVAAALGYSNSRDAIIRHCRYVVKRDAPHPQSPDRKISMTFIPEGDLYRLIVHSKLPSAEQFEQWVFDEVLPTIRKHGAYLTREKLWEVATSPEALMKLCSDLLAEREANISLRKENAHADEKNAQTGVKKSCGDGDIICHDLHYSYEEDREILHGIDVTLKKDNFTAIVGESGCGKSTLSACLWEEIRATQVR